MADLQTISVRLPESTVEELDEERDEESRSSYVREIVEDRHRADDLEAKRDELRRQLQAANSRNEEHTELVEYVRQERELRESRREYKDAPVWTRAKRWVLGSPNNSEADS